MALDELQMPTIMLWPNVDAGSEDIATGMRTFREKRQPEYIRFYKNFPIETYVRLMLLCACAVGNSSAPIREGAFLGVPTVNIGTPAGRAATAGPTCSTCAYDRGAIVDGRPPPARARTLPVRSALRRRRGGSADRRRAGDGAAVASRSACVFTHAGLMQHLGRHSRARRVEGHAEQEPARRSAAVRCSPTRPMPRAAAGG